MAASDPAFRPPPTVDPTVLTTDLLLREMHSLERLFNVNIDTVLERINAINALYVELEARLLRNFHEVDEKIAAHEHLEIERFTRSEALLNAHAAQDIMRHTAEQDAVAAALLSRKEAALAQETSNQKAIDKSERTTADTINKLQDLFASSNNALSAQIGDLKDRVGRIESLKQGAVEVVTNRREERSLGYQGYGLVVAAFATFIAVGSLIAAIALKP